MIRRRLVENFANARSDTPVVLVHGARQTGKSTLVRAIADASPSTRYLTLDDATVLSAARNDPESLLSGSAETLVFDEIQRAPGLLLAIKAEVDRDRRPGRFLLTGSANVLHLPRLSETLAGRMEVLTLWPFSQGEMLGSGDSFVESLRANKLPTPPKKPVDREDLIRRAVLGGFPEVVSRPRADRRAAWFESYLATVLQRDVRDIADIEAASALPRLLSLVASRASGLHNASDLSRSLGLPASTLKRYLALLETVFLIRFLPAWSTNASKRLMKAPKVMISDTGLLAHLGGIDSDDPGRSALVGPLLENFVAMELEKQIGWSTSRPRLFHFRTLAGREVDLVLEWPGGDIVGIEVKASSSVGAADFKGLNELAEIAGKKFRRGVVLYAGREAVPFGKSLDALPISAVWS